MKRTVSGRTLSLIFVILVSLICCDVSFAETGYVSDMLILTMREGPGSNFNVIRTLRSNEALDILEKGETHFKVRTVDGDEGWIEKQYITLETPKTMIIDELNRKVADLEKALLAGEGGVSEAVNNVQKYRDQVADLTASLKNSAVEKKELQERNTRLESELKQLKASLTALKSSVSSGGLVAENEALKKEVETLTRKMNSLTSQGDEPLKTGMIKWFVSGAGVLLAGWFIGKSMIRGRKKPRGLLG